MAWRLTMAAQERWRRVTAPHLVALVKPGVKLPDGEAKMLQCEPEPKELIMPIPWTTAADGVPVYKI
jgi:hypothetical protein